VSQAANQVGTLMVVGDYTRNGLAMLGDNQAFRVKLIQQ